MVVDSIMFLFSTDNQYLHVLTHVFPTRPSSVLEGGAARAEIAEISHRSPEVMQVAAEAEADLRRLLSIPDDYAVLFLPGGATTPQALVALNFAAPGQAAAYVVSGHWAKVALKQAQAYVAATISASREAPGFRDLPPAPPWPLSRAAHHVPTTPH